MTLLKAIQDLVHGLYRLYLRWFYFWNLTVSVPIVSKKKKNILDSSSFVFIKARKWYWFGTTWEWVNDYDVSFFGMNYSYKASNLDSFGDFPRSSCWSDLTFPSHLYFFFFSQLRSYLHNNMNFLLHNSCLDKRPDLQIHRHLNVKYYSAKAGLWPFVIILQYKVAKTAQKVSSQVSQDFWQWILYCILGDLQCNLPKT